MFSWRIGRCVLAHQLPGTFVGRPCKNAWLSSDKCPTRSSACRSWSHTSWVRSQRTNSVTPCKPPCALEAHTSCWPCKLNGSFLDETPVTRCQGICPRKVPRGGGSCHRSPDRMTLSPPKGATQLGFCLPYFVVETSKTSWRHRASRRANISALTMLISSISSQRHCTACCARSRIRCASTLWSLPCQANPNAWCMVSPSKGSALTAWNATTWNSFPGVHPRHSSNKSRRAMFSTYDLPVPGPPWSAQRNASVLVSASTLLQLIRKLHQLRT